MTKEEGLYFYSMMIAYNFDVEVERVGFMNVVIRLESLGVWDFGLVK